MAIRSEQSRQAILQSTMKLLDEREPGAISVQQLSIERIAREAGVSKTTIYRWWPNKAAVIIDTFLENHILQTTLRDDIPPIDALREHVISLAKVYSGHEGRLMAQLIAESQYDSATLDAFERVSVLDEMAASEDGEEVSTSALQGLHAKAFIAETGWDTILTIGSGNATRPALLSGNNVELFASLRGKRSKVGSVEQIMDPVFSTGKFYDGLVKVDGYTKLDVTVAAQAVQRSGFPDAYAQHETRARAWASALTGNSPEALTCELRAPLPGGDVARLTARVARDLPSADVSTDAGRRTVSIAPGGLDGEDPSAAARTRAALAHWAVAVADEQQVVSVSVDGRTWQRDSGAWTDTDAVESALRGPDGVVVVTVAR